MSLSVSAIETVNQRENAKLQLMQEPELDAALTMIIAEQNLYQQVLNLPSGTPATGPLFELGRQLFFSKSLSMQQDVACASCHHPLLGGGDGLSLSVGVNAVDPDVVGPGRLHDGDPNIDPRADGLPNVPRNASSIFNLFLLNKAAFWDGRVEVIESQSLNPDSVQEHKSIKLRTPDSLMDFADPAAGQDFIQAQARFPLVAIHEMFGFGSEQVSSNHVKRDLLMQRLRSVKPLQVAKTQATGSAAWLRLFQLAFDDKRDNAQEVIQLDRVTQALAHYQRSLVLTNNPWFAYIKGDKTALTKAAKQGALLFFSAPQQGGFQCQSCHSGVSFSDEQFYNLSIPQIGRGKTVKGHDHGRLLATSKIKDMFKFRTPMLLNVQVTGPWSHTGAYDVLANMVRHHFDPMAMNQQYDFSLLHLAQFKNHVNSAARSQIINQAIIDNFASTVATTPLVTMPQNNQQNAQLLTAFLWSLTDSCIQQVACLQKWMPVIGDQGPDGMQLQAKFSAFSAENDANHPAAFVEAVSVPIANHTRPEWRWFENVSKRSGLVYPLAEATFSDEYHLMGGGVAVDDFDQDGWQDLFISHAMQPGKLFRNNQQGGFDDVTEARIGHLAGRQLGALFLDYDADGDKDLLLVEDDINNQYFTLLSQLSSGAMRPNVSKAGLGFKRFTHSLAAGDYDQDGDLDLFASHWGDVLTPTRQGYLWNNSGQGMFEDVSASLPQTRISPLYPQLDVNFVAIFSDIDNDQDSDLLIAADYETSQILRNRQGTFEDVTSAQISDENGMGSAVGDYDNDGDLDWFVSSIWNPIDNKAYKGGSTGNRLYQNDGKGDFTDVTSQAGVREGYWGWGACFADFNNDGWLDIFHTNGMRTGQAAQESQVGQFYQDPSRLFINQHDGTFKELAIEWGMDHRGQGRGVSCLDYDKDGDIDVLIANNGASPNLYRNHNLQAFGYFAVQLQASPQNPDGVGAKVFITLGEQRQMREIRLGSNYLSNDPLIAHFGVGKATTIDLLRVVWPDGQQQEFRQLNTNQYFRVTKADANDPHHALK